MSDRIGRLIGFQRAEAVRAGRLRMWMMTAQVLVGLVAVLGVLFEGTPSLAALAVGSLLAIGWWILLETRYQRSRVVAGRARRAILVEFGLGRHISDVEYLSITQDLFAKPDDAKLFEDASYFASPAPPGHRRLGEMIQESAFWTARLQAESAKFMWAAFLVSAVIVALAFWLIVGSVEGTLEDQTARAVTAIAATLMSTDILGSALAHSTAAAATDRIVARVADAEGRRFPEADVLLILADYSVVAEIAPVAVPGLYALHKERLSRLFKQFSESRVASGG